MRTNRFWTNYCKRTTGAMNMNRIIKARISALSVAALAVTVLSAPMGCETPQSTPLASAGGTSAKGGSVATGGTTAQATTTPTGGSSAATSAPAMVCVPGESITCAAATGPGSGRC